MKQTTRPTVLQSITTPAQDWRHTTRHTTRSPRVNSRDGALAQVINLWTPSEWR